MSNGLECPVLIFPGLEERVHSLDRHPSLNFLFELPLYVHRLILILAWLELHQIDWLENGSTGAKLH